MKILVGISKTPDTTAKISFTDEQTKFDEAGVQHIMNPYDEWYALVKALELKEENGGSVTVVHVGGAENDTIIRKALAIGADDALRVDKTATSSLDVATQMAAIAQTNGYDLILLGKETINYNGSEVGSMLSALLDQPFISYATRLEVSDDKLEIDRDIEGGTETLLVPTPCIVSSAKGIAEQRIPNMRGIMMAKRKPLEVVTPVESQDRTRIVQYDLPIERTECTIVESDQMDELVRLLHEEAKVI